MENRSENVRANNSVRNIMWGVYNGIAAVLFPFVARAIILHLLGANYLGIGTLFTSILQFLNLTELGVGSAITYAMYKPIAEGDNELLCSILNYIRKLYRIIGVSMLVIGTVIIPAVPYLIHGNPPDGVNIYVLYYIYLINTVISYFFAGYRESLLIAHQRRDLVMKYATFVSVIMQIVQIAVLIAFKDFYVYAIVPIAGTISTNLINTMVTRKLFPLISPKGKISTEKRNEIVKKMSGLIGIKLSSVVHHSSDTIVISAFLGLTSTAQYGNYYSVFYAVCGFIATIFTSMTASIGDKLVRDSLEDNYRLFKHISFANNWMVGWFTVVLVCILEPLIGKIFGKDMCFGVGFASLMGLYFYVYQIQRTVLTFKDAAGIWYEDRFRPYVTMIINLVSNIILVNFIGIYGIVISTILSLLVLLPWINITLFGKLFHRSPIENMETMMKNGVVTAVMCVVVLYVTSFLDESILGIMIRLAICVVVPNAILVLIYRRTDSFEYWKKYLAYYSKKLRSRGN